MIPRDMKENKVLFHSYHHHLDHHHRGMLSEGPKSNVGAAETGLFSVKEKVKQNARECFVEMLAKQITRNTWGKQTRP